MDIYTNNPEKTDWLLVNQSFLSYASQETQKCTARWEESIDV